MKKRTSKLLSLLLTLTMVLGMLSFMSTTAMAVTVLIGDVDGNGAVNKADSILLDRYVANWTGYADKVNMDAADVNRDGNVNNADAILLARYIAKWTVESQIGQTVEVGEPEELKIVKEPVDVEFIEKSAVLSITVSGNFDSIVYEWQKQTSLDWRDVATLNSDDATYTVNNSALHIVSRNGTEGFGKYRCIVSAFNGGQLVAQVTSRVADVDPEAAPMKALLGRMYTTPLYYYFYHLLHNSGETEPVTERPIIDNPTSYVLKNYTQKRFQEAMREIIIEPFWECGYDNGEWPDAFIYNNLPYDNSIGRKKESGEYYTNEMILTNNYAVCSIESVSGGKGPYTYTWYLSKDRFGNDYQPLIEGYNCYGQGTENIMVWPSDTSNQGIRFMGFLCCRITDSKGRTTNACYEVSESASKEYIFRHHNMLYAEGENSSWFDSPNANIGPGLTPYWHYTLPNNQGIGRWW